MVFSTNLTMNEFTLCHRDKRKRINLAHTVLTRKFKLQNINCERKGTAMKTKIFKVSGYRFYFGNKPKSKQVLENEINDWLDANSGIKIVDIKQSCCGGSFNPRLTVVSIWYEPKA